jgi:3-oxoacyl-[acyl-carrier protein] reductase
MEFGLKDRTALLGGASKGLGRACAEALAAEGCRLVLWSRGGEDLERSAGEIRSAHGAEVHTVGVDATDPGAAATVTAAATEAVGQVDILVLNAGGPPPTDPAQTDPEGWRRAFQLLAITPIELATALLPGMRERGWGRIVGVLSSTIREPIPNLVYSTGGRLALAGWMKTTARAVARDGVTINGILPGRLDTDRVAQLDGQRAEREGRSLREVRAASEVSIPAGRYGRPEELGWLAAFLCSERASYITGALVPVDGGSIQSL